MAEICFPFITLVDPSGDVEPCSGDEFDFTMFTHIDLTAYGGEIVPVTSNEEIVNLLDELGFQVFIEGCNIYIINGQNNGDIPVCGYTYIDLYDPLEVIEHCVFPETLNFSAFQYIDFTQFGGTVQEVNSESDIIDILSTLGFTATIEGCQIVIHSCDPYDDLPISVDQTIEIVDTDEDIEPCQSLVYNYNNFDAIDLSFYGGPSEVPVNNDLDVENAFAALGITAVVEGCIIRLIGYTDPVENVECCLFTRINIVDSEGNPLCDGDAIDFTAFNQVNFIPYGGEIETISNSSQLVDTLHSLIGYDVSIEGCNIVLHSCTIEGIDLIGTSGDCANIEVSQSFLIASEVFEIQLAAYIQTLVGPDDVIPDGELLRVEVKDSSDVVIAFANTIIGQNWSTPAGVLPGSVNWLGATGFSTFTYSPAGNEGGGVLLNGAALSAGINIYFQKRDWAVANGYGGVGLGQDYTVSFSFPNLESCADSFDVTIPKVTEGQSYDLDMFTFVGNQEPGNTCCRSVLDGFTGSDDIPVGVFDERFFDEDTLEVFDLTGSWIPAVVQTSDGEDCPAGMSITFPDPNNDDLRHVCLEQYISNTDPTGIRITTQDHPDVLATIAGLVCVIKGHVKTPIIRTNSALKKFLSVNSNPFPKQVIVEEYFSHFHDTTLPFLDVNCPINMVRADVYVANDPGLAEDPLLGQVYHSSVPVDPLYPFPPGTNQNVYTNQLQLHTFSEEGVYVYRSEFERGPDCINFSGDWNDPDCDVCNGPNQDDLNDDGEISGPFEDNTSYKIGFYVITSY